MTSDVDRAVRESLTDCFREIRVSHWRGREREAVSLYAFGFLQKQCAPGRLLHDPAQIGIEVAVPGIGEVNRKRQVCKDLVIWAAPGMSCWDENWTAVTAPLAILEWKLSRRGMVRVPPSRYDLDWLTQFSSQWGEFTGYAVSLAIGAREALVVARVRGGDVQRDWLKLEG